MAIDTTSGVLWLASPYMCLAVIAWLTRRYRSGRWLVSAGVIGAAIPSLWSACYVCNGGPEGGRAILVAPFFQLPFVGLLGLVCAIAYGRTPVRRWFTESPQMPNEPSNQSVQGTRVQRPRS